jgi:hypothetical protein
LNILLLYQIPDAADDLRLLHAEVALPSSCRPSDHVSLGVVFSYLEDVRGHDQSNHLLSGGGQAQEYSGINSSHWAPMGFN